MSQNSIFKKDSYNFAKDIVFLYKHLTVSKHEYVLSKQLLRSGTSIAANIHEAIGSQTRKDFFSKISISYKEALETEFWLELVKDCDYIDLVEFNYLNSKLVPILKMLSATKLTVQKSLIKVS